MPFVEPKSEIKFPAYSIRENTQILAQQEMLEQVVDSEAVNIEMEALLHEKILAKSDVTQKCIPIYTRISRSGDVTIRFTKRIIITTKNVDKMMEKIVSSGSI